MFNHLTLTIVPAVFAVYIPMCAPHVRPTAPPWETPMAQLWEKPLDLDARDLYHGPWGSERAPDPRATYTFVARKQHGTNPGVTVIDARGREWHVKQAPRNHQGAEGPVEVVLSRVLSAVGYHQPPVYFVPSFTMTDASGTHQEPGGRFRLKVSALDQARGLVVAAESLRRHQAVSGTARDPRDVRQFRSQEREQHVV